MALEARIGILRDRLVVEGVEYPIRHEGGGWVSVAAARRRVRYEPFRDRIRIEGPGFAVAIPFRWRQTTFGFGGRRYRVGPMAWGHVMVSRDGRPVITGHVTMSGVRFGYVAAELQPIARELAVGLAYRAIAIWLALGSR